MLAVSFTLLSAVVAIIAVFVVGALLLVPVVVALFVATLLVVLALVLVKSSEAVLFCQIHGTCRYCFSLVNQRERFFALLIHIVNLKSAFSSDGGYVYSHAFVGAVAYSACQNI